MQSFNLSISEECARFLKGGTMKHMIIYGADEYGLYAKKTILDSYKDLQTIYFSDQKEKLMDFHNMHPEEPIIEEKFLSDQTDKQIVIASLGHREQKYTRLMECKISPKRILKDWRGLEEIPYTRTAIEITSGCNARCKYCPTGRYNFERGKAERGDFLSFEDFKEIMLYMQRKHILLPGAIVDLYNWGEPFWNPDFKRIAIWLSENGYEFTASTNASIPVCFEGKEDLSGLKNLIFSMPGFSQTSYDKIHGFSFEKIKRNIQSMVENFRMHGFTGHCKIAFHIYQFNIHEISLAKKFARQLDIDFYPYFAIPAAIDLAFGFIDRTIDYSVLREMSKDLITFYIDDLVQERPADYSCQQDNLLTINEKGQLILGCCANSHSKVCGDNYCLGDIQQMELKDIKQKKKEIFNSSTCSYCRKIGADYFGSNGGNRSSEILRKILTDM